MRLAIRAREVAPRLSAGAYILHSGLEKWRGGDEQAAWLQGMAMHALPVFGRLAPRRFLRLLAAGEIVTGAALLTPVVPAAVAGTALTAFATGLMTLYARAPGLRQPGSIWPTQDGIGIAKDVWLVGIGVGLLTDAARAGRPGRVS